MKINYNFIPPVPPQHEITLTLSPEEAKVLQGLLAGKDWADATEVDRDGDEISNHANAMHDELYFALRDADLPRFKYEHLERTRKIHA